MSRLVLYMSMSLDGFITGSDDGMDRGLGVDPARLAARRLGAGVTRPVCPGTPGGAQWVR